MQALISLAVAAFYISFLLRGFFILIAIVFGLMSGGILAGLLAGLIAWAAFAVFHFLMIIIFGLFSINREDF